MHFSPVSLLTTAILVLPQVVLADFHIYRLKVTNLPWKPDGVGWHIFDDAGPDCNKVIYNRPIWNEQSSVAGSSMGFRCKGEGCDQVRTPHDIEQLEFHTGNNPLLHFTLYKPAYNMIGLDGRIYGNCVVATHNDYDCWLGGTIKYEGRRKFRCTSSISGTTMNAQG